jgi:hypothetical protein
MPVDVQITVEDPKFFEALNNPDGFLPVLEASMKNILDEYKQVAEVYAPESEANRPGRFDKHGKPMGYYERGRGWWYPLMTRSTLQSNLRTIGEGMLKTGKSKAVNAFLIAGGVAGYRLIPSSQQMDKRWTVEVERKANEVIGILANSATYSGYVQGMEQTVLHASRQWRTVMTSWEDTALQSLVDAETVKAIAEYYNV